MADSTGHLPRGPGRILTAAQWSMQGLRAAWLHESSFRREVFLFVVLAPLAWWLGETPVERALMIGSLPFHSVGRSARLSSVVPPIQFRSSVMVKSLIDQFREQVQNVE